MAEEEEVGLNLMPCLPNEIAMACLVRLTPQSRAMARCVSRAWCTALRNCSSIHHLRTCLNLPPEYWIFMGVFDTDFHGGYVRATHHNTKWLLLDPLSLATLTTPNPLDAGIPIDMGLRSAATNFKLFLPEISREKMGFWCYDIENREGGGDHKWNIPLPPLVHGQQRKRFACAADKRFMYIGGGLLEVSREASGRACRYDTLTNRWETLPDMLLPRINCAGVVMNGKFFAIGGYHSSQHGFIETHASGEVFDPETWEWRLVPNLGGSGLRHAENSDVEEPTVAVVENNLYAVQSQSNQVMQFEWSEERWEHLGYVGGDCERRSNVVSYRLLGVGSQLWAIEYAAGKSMSIHACTCDVEKRSGRESQHVKWRKIEVAEMERFDHLLTCTVVKV